jgi:hypothetical protein
MSSTPPTSPQRSQAAGRHTERANRIMGSPEQRRTPAAPLAPSAAVPPPSNQSRGPVTFGGQTYHNLPPHLVAQMATTAPFSAAPQPSTSSAMPPPLNPNSSERAVTFGGQTYHNLPPDLAAQLAAVAPFPAAPQNRRRYRQPSIPFHTPIPVSAFTSFAANPASASTSTPAPAPASIPIPALAPISASASASTSTSASTSALAVPPQYYRRRPATSLLAPAPVSFFYLLLLKH